MRTSVIARPEPVALPRFRFEVTLLDARGRPLRGEVQQWPNVLTTAGKLWYADFARGLAGTTKLATVAIGTDGTAAAEADELLGAEVARLALPAAGTDTATDKNIRSGAIVTFQVVFGPGPSGTIREVGVFSDIASPPGAADSGTLVHRAVIGPFGMTGSNQLRVRGLYNYA